MRIPPAAAVAASLAIALPAAGEEGFDWRAYFDFRVEMAMDDVIVTRWKPAFKLQQCNVEASKKLARVRKSIDLVKRPIESEAAEAMAACASEADELAKAVPATEAEGVKAAIVRANAKVIMNTRDPPTIVCAGDIPAAMCWTQWRR